jgi:hypothetical protein
MKEQRVDLLTSLHLTPSRLGVSSDNVAFYSDTVVTGATLLFGEVLAGSRVPRVERHRLIEFQVGEEGVIGLT